MGVKDPGDTKRVSGRDHGIAVGLPARIPTDEKNCRDTPPGLRGHAHHWQVAEEQQKQAGKYKEPTDGSRRGAGFPIDKSQLPENNPEYRRALPPKAPIGPVKSKSGAHKTYDEVVIAHLGGGEEKVDTDVA
jgi:hypothetical protein